MKIKIIIYAVLFIFFINNVDAKITEIMYNPPGNDNNLEYVEMVFNNATNIAGWKINDSAFQDVLVLINGSGNSKINLIVEDGYFGDYFKNINLTKASVYSAGAAIGNGLNNDGDSVSLYTSDNKMIDKIEYNGSIGNGDGNALCISENDEHYSCIPNPGEYEDGDIPIANETTFIATNVSASKKEIDKEDSYIRIDFIENPPMRGCKFLTVYTSLFNNKKAMYEVRAYIQEINVITKINIDAGQKLEIGLPVATCNNTINSERGDYVVVVEGFEEKDMKLVYLSGLEYQCRTQSVSLKNSAIENNINSFSEIKEEVKLSADTINAVDSRFKGLGFYLAYLVGGLSFYYILFKG